MSTPTSSPPPRDNRHRERRVSFDIGNSEKAPGFFNQLAAASYTTMPRNFASNGGGHSRNSSHHRHQNRSRLDRLRTRIEDVDDDDDSEASDRGFGRGAGRRNERSDRNDRDRYDRADQADRAATAAANAAAVAGPPLDGGLPRVQPGQPSITASAAAAGYNGLDPAAGANHVFTHMENGMQGVQTHPGMPGFPGPGMIPNGQNIQAFPTFMPAGMPPGFAAYAPGAVGPGGVDSSGMTGTSFLPAVPDATNGPMLHTYIPRGDAPGQAGGMYMQPGYNQPGYNSAMAGVPIAATTSPMIPIATQGGVAYIQQPQPQVAYVGGGGMGGGMGGGGPPMMMMPGMGVPGGPGPGGNHYGGVHPGVHPEPALGVGQTPSEVLQEQLEFAYNNNMYEPQDFKPADDDKSRFYWVREMDGNWTQRSRATIDHIGCRWYITDSGVFYAVRLPN